MEDDWGWSFMVPGIIIAIMGLINWFLMVPKPEFVGLDDNSVSEVTFYLEECILVTLFCCFIYIYCFSKLNFSSYFWTVSYPFVVSRIQDLCNLVILSSVKHMAVLMLAYKQLSSTGAACEVPSALPDVAVPACQKKRWNHY